MHCECHENAKPMASPPPCSAFVNGGDETITALHSDIILSLILTRLDGPNLATTACVSCHLRSLSTEENLWRHICSSTWPSINQPRTQRVISTFPSGHRSFFSDSFPFPNPGPLKLHVSSLPLATELISAVDVYYQGNPICSKVLEMETSSDWFLSSPFRVDLFSPNVPAPSPTSCSCNDDTWLKHLEDNLSLSWIFIDPNRKKAVNMSSERAVWVQRHWLTGNVQLRFGIVMDGDQRWGSSREFVECGVVVTCGENGREELHVREVSMRMEDMEGKGLSGEESLVILQRVIESERKRKDNGGKQKYEEFLEKKSDRKEKNGRKERVLDLICILSIFAVCGAFWSLTLPMYLDS